MRTNHGLTVPILDALSNLTLKPELLSEVTIQLQIMISSSLRLPEIFSGYLVSAAGSQARLPTKSTDPGE